MSRDARGDERQGEAPRVVVDRLVWAAQAVAFAHGVTLEPEVTRSRARLMMGQPGATWLDGLREALGPSGLEVFPGESSAGATDAARVVWRATGPELWLPRAAGWVEVRTVAGRKRRRTSAVASSVDDGAPWCEVVQRAPAQSLVLEHGAHGVGRRVWRWLRLERRELGAVLVYAAAVGALSLATPVAVQTLVSSVAFGSLVQPIVVLALLFLVALGLQAALRALQAVVVERVQRRAFARVAVDLAWRRPRQAAPHGEPTRFMEIVSLQKSAATLLTDGVATALVVAIGLAVLAAYHPALLAFALVLVLVTAVVVLLPWRSGLHGSLEESHAKYAVLDWLQVLAAKPGLFRSTAGRAFASERMEDRVSRYLGARARHFRVAFGQGVSALALQVLASAAVLGLGGWLVVRRQLTLGQLVAAELIVTSVAAGLAKVGKLLDAAYDLGTAVDKLGHLLDGELGREGAAPRTTGPARLSLQGVPGLPQTTEAWVAEPGARVALAGALGVGFGARLVGHGDGPLEGDARLDGLPLAQWPCAALADRAALVDGHGLFDGGTLEEQLTVGTPTGGPAVREALVRVGLEGWLQRLPDGLSTVLERVEHWPEEVRLRLEVARLLLTRPGLVVLDTDFAAVPADGRASLWAEVLGPSAPWTVVALVDHAGSELARACAAAHADGGAR